MFKELFTEASKDHKEAEYWIVQQMKPSEVSKLKGKKADKKASQIGIQKEAWKLADKLAKEEGKPYASCGVDQAGKYTGDK